MSPEKKQKKKTGKAKTMGGSFVAPKKLLYMLML